MNLNFTAACNEYMIGGLVRLAGLQWACVGVVFSSVWISSYRMNIMNREMTF